MTTVWADLPGVPNAACAVESAWVNGGSNNVASGGSDWIATGCPHDMVKIGKLCVDTYEASVWSARTGGTQYGVGDYPCTDDGRRCTTVYARSVVGVTPSSSITWFQAQQAPLRTEPVEVMPVAVAA